MEDNRILRTHYDADGICSGYLTSFKYPYKIQIWDGEFGDTTGMTEGSIMCDMHPTTDLPKDCIVIDHHQINDYPLKRSYTLIADNVPASLIAWNNFKEEIPKSEWFKVVCGITGDGQPELIPPEIYKQCPQLLNQLKTSAYQSYGKWKLGYYPIYKLLSSPINALLRKGDFDNALKLITEAQSPNDIIYNPEAIKAKEAVRSEFEGIVRNCESYDYQHLNIIIYYSKWRMSGYVASALQSSLDNKTVIAINRRDGHGSMRGDLTLYWADKFKHLGYVKTMGHPGFFGFQIKKNVQTFIEDVTKVLI